MKKRNIFLVTVVILLFALTACGKQEGATGPKKESTTNGENQNVNSSQEDNNENNQMAQLDDYEIIIDGISFVFPMTYQEFIEKGLKIQDIHQRNEDLLFENRIVGSGSAVDSYRAAFTIFETDKTNNISIIVSNNSDKDKIAKECYVTGFKIVYDRGDTPNPKFGEFKIINHSKNSTAIMGESKIKDIETSFGEKFLKIKYNDFRYCPDVDNDGEITISDITGTMGLSLYFDSESEILISKDFFYNNNGIY